MAKERSVFEQYFYAVLWIAIFASVIYLAVRNIGTFGNILLVAVGFGAFVLVHEFGHFIFAKFCGIKVEAFSIGFPPTLIGILRTERGHRIRILPQFFPKEGGSDDGKLSFTVGKKMQQPGETEYRIGVIPFGGFVKMLGQEDVGPVKDSDDPRSFANKSVGARMAVIAAGVVFNAISALIVFMIVFLIGINRVPAVVGGVVEDSPAARVGLRAGDEVVKIGDRSRNLDYYDIAISAALSGKGEEIALKVKHEDGSIGDYSLTAEKRPGAEVKEFGIIMPQSLTVAEVSDANKLLAKTGLRPGDLIKAVNGRDVQSYWELAEIVENALVPKVTLLAERTNKSGESQLVESEVGLELTSAGTGQIYSMVPRFRMEEIKITESTWTRIAAGMRQLLERIGVKERLTEKQFLQSNDVILSVGEVICPTYDEFSETVKRCEDNELPVNVLRTDANGIETQHTINVRLKRGADVNEAKIGISYFRMYDFDHPVVAKTIAVDGGPPKLEIPRGALITSVDGKKVSDFYDIISQISQSAGKRIKITYLAGGEVGSVTLDVSGGEESVTIKSVFADYVPFKPLERLYKASSPVDAIGMGYRKTVMFIAQAYITLKGLATGLFSPKGLMGPVGILTFSYRIVAERPLIDYAYFLGLISASLAVFNILPLLPFDGGFIVFLLIEKIKGSPVSARVQEKIASAGWMLVIALVLYVTFNDIVRSFFS